MWYNNSSLIRSDLVIWWLLQNVYYVNLKGLVIITCLLNHNMSLGCKNENFTARPIIHLNDITSLFFKLKYAPVIRDYSYLNTLPIQRI